MSVGQACAETQAAIERARSLFGAAAESGSAAANSADAIAAQTHPTSRAPATASTPAGRRAILAALRSQLSQASDVVSSTNQQASGLAGQIRGLTYPHDTRGGPAQSGSSPDDDPIALEARRLAWEALHKPQQCTTWQWTRDSGALLLSLGGAGVTLAGAPLGPLDWAALGLALGGAGLSIANVVMGDWTWSLLAIALPAVMVLVAYRAVGRHRAKGTSAAQQ
jgi:hypothetical protein